MAGPTQFNSAYFNPILYVNSQPAAVDGFGMLPTVIQEEISAIEQGWENDILNVALDRRDLYRTEIQSLVKQLRSRAFAMLGKSSLFDIRLEMQRMKGDLGSCLAKFYAASAAYQKDKVEEEKSHADYAAELQDTYLCSSVYAMPDFDFGKPLHFNFKADDDDVGKNQEMLEEKTVSDQIDSFGPSNFINRPFYPILAELAKEGSEEHETDFSLAVKQWANGKIAHHIEHRFGKTQGYSTEFLSHFYLSPLPEGTTSPWRDQIISTAVHIGISEVVKMAIPGRLQAYTVTLGANMCSEMGKNAEESLKSLSKREEAKEMAMNWDRQWLLSGQEGPTFTSAVASATCLAKGMQVPHDVLHAIHHEITEMVAKIGNDMGLTDEAVSVAVERAFQWIKEKTLEHEAQCNSLGMYP